MAFATESLQNAAADGETRTLSFHHTHSGEDLTVTFKRNGRYDDRALASLNHLLRDWRNQDEIKMDPRLFDVVWEVNQDVGGRAPIQIISAYRSPATNAMLRRRSRGVAKFSQHMLGKAMDFNIPGVSLEQVRIAGLRLQRGGVGFYPTSGSPFVHLDVGSVRHWPRMTHDQLARVFPDGRTVHVPSDGQPLSGYTQALADVERRGAAPSQVSLAAARDSGAVSATRVADKGKRGFISRLFGFGARDEEDDEETKPSRRATVIARANAEEASKPAKTANVPMPRPRPGDGALLVASNGPETRQASAPVGSPAQVVQSRGLWQTSEMLAAANVQAERSSAPRQRLVWQTGPQPLLVKGTTSVVGKSTASARRALAAATPAVTGSMPPWPGAAPTERGPEMVLAYASPSAPERSVPVAAKPMGSLQATRAAPSRPKSPAAPARPSREPQTASAPLSENPWLRGVIATPSVQFSLGVTVMGAPNYRALAELMHKPRVSVMNAFADDTPFGLSTERFSGEAVGYLPLVTFPTVTAQLR